jgi:two-component system C4-dicarboxylate transport response regulator DctD
MWLAEGGPMSGTTMLVVVIDDDYDTSEFVRDVLLDAGYTIVTWSRAAGAHQLIRDEQPGLVILDLQMPGDLQAGMWLFEQLHHDPETTHIPIILYSSDHWAVRRHASVLQAAGGDVLGKPFDVLGLDAMITRLTRTP